ncbi:phage major capsid protein [Rhizobium sp. RCAM05973]|uniref:phage major capsid protein n=1 Tax=Rhizobium sp. RCAM05973 TaxID=2994066 RepID=UPI0022EC044C|nr:phage major capsid protein [Rhizobium sp. RCAM05973]
MKHVSSRALAIASALTPPRAIIGQGIRADNTDPKAMISQIQAAFEEFKKANDEKLNGKADVVLDEKVERIDASIGNFQKAIDDINAKIAAASFGGGGGGDMKPVDPEYSETWAKFFRHGDDESSIRAKQKDGPRAQMTVGSNPDGGYLAPIEWDRTITSKLKEISPMRQNAHVQSISGAGIRKVYNDRAVVSGWVGETAARPATGTPQLGVLDFVPGEIYAFPFASQNLLEDSEVNLEQWLGGEVDVEFSRQENIAFVSGDGVNKPFGVLTYVVGAANAAKHPWGAIGVINSGAAAAIAPDSIIDIIQDVPASYRIGAKFYMNRQTQSSIRKLKDGQNNYLWQPSYAAGQPATLAGEAIVEFPDMPGVAAGNIAALYGNMELTYLIVDRIGIIVLRDPYTNKPFVGFYTRKRVGGGVTNPEPMRALKISA